MEELSTIASNAGRSFVPHVISDSFGNRTLCTAPKTQVQAYIRKALTAITVATWTASWATHFQQGLTDNRVWEKFNEH